jgi:hypothetical protein
MAYTAEQCRIAKQLAKQLSRIAGIAGDNELYMGNGGDIGSMLGGIVIEFEDIANSAPAAKHNPAKCTWPCEVCADRDPKYFEKQKALGNTMKAE